ARGDRRRRARAGARAGRARQGRRGGRRRDLRGLDRRASLHPRPARPRPHHPHLRRAAPLRLPAVAVGALRVLVLRDLLARLPPRGPAARAARLLPTRAPLRRLRLPGSEPPARRPTSVPASPPSGVSDGTLTVSGGPAELPMAIG